MLIDNFIAEEMDLSDSEIEQLEWIVSNGDGCYNLECDECVIKRLKLQFDVPYCESTLKELPEYNSYGTGIPLQMGIVAGRILEKIEEKGGWWGL